MADLRNNHGSLFSFNLKELIIELFLYSVCIANIFVNYKEFWHKSEGLT